MYYTVLIFDVGVMQYLFDFQNESHSGNFDLSLTGLLQEKHIPTFAEEKETN